MTGRRKEEQKKSGLKNRRSQKERFMEDHEKKTLYRCNHCTYHHRSNGIMSGCIFMQGLSGSFGIVLSVPLTVTLCAFVMKREIAWNKKTVCEASRKQTAMAGERQMN